MTYRNSSWTGRSARTLQEAFGPYETYDNGPSGYPWAWWAAFVGVGLIGLIVIVAMG